MKNCFIIHSFYTYILNVLQFVNPTLPTALTHPRLLLQHALVYPLLKYPHALLLLVPRISHLLVTQLQPAHLVPQHFVNSLILNAVPLHVLEDARICLNKLSQMYFHSLFILVVL